MQPNYQLYFDTLNAKMAALTAKSVQPTAYLNVQRSVDAGRTAIIFYASAAAVGTTTTETAITWTIASGSAATTTGVTYAVPTGKKLRLTSLHFGSVGNATGALAATTFNLRVNASAITTSSTPLIAAVKIVNAAVNLDFKTVDVSIPEGYEVAAGLNIGLTTNCVFAAGAPTSEFLAIGYLY